MDYTSLRLRRDQLGLMHRKSLWWSLGSSFFNISRSITAPDTSICPLGKRRNVLILSETPYKSLFGFILHARDVWVHTWVIPKSLSHSVATCPEAPQFWFGQTCLLEWQQGVRAKTPAGCGPAELICCAPGKGIFRIMSSYWGMCLESKAMRWGLTKKPEMTRRSSSNLWKGIVSKCRLFTEWRKWRNISGLRSNL